MTTTAVQDAARIAEEGMDLFRRALHQKAVKRIAAMNTNNPTTVELVDHQTGQSYRCGTLVIAKSKAAGLRNPGAHANMTWRQLSSKEWRARVDGQVLDRFTVYM